MNYREDISPTLIYKKEYLDGLDRLIKQKQETAKQARADYAKQIFDTPEKYREDFKRMLGWPLVDHSDSSLPTPTSELLSKEEGYSIYRMRFEILDGVIMTGLLFRLDGDEKKPLVIVQHGGDGTPEIISGIHGSTYNYNDMLERVLPFGVHVFAPQLLLWSDDYGINNDRQSIDTRLKRVGSSITAVEIYGITRILDYFETQDYVLNFGMIGLSYGGFYTLFTTAVETRIHSAISCAFFNTRDQYPWIDWTWFDAAKRFDDAEVACLVYPRKLCIEIANQDGLFDVQYGLKSFETLKEYCREVGTDWVELITFDGVHEFCKDDAPIARLCKELLAE